MMEHQLSFGLKTCNALRDNVCIVRKFWKNFEQSGGIPITKAATTPHDKGWKQLCYESSWQQSPYDKNYNITEF
jgi:hypothetical protein